MVVPAPRFGFPTLAEQLGLNSVPVPDYLDTKVDAPRIAKTKRQARKGMGARPRPRQTIPGSRASGWKHKLNGQWERRT